jgi:hypothetical protein
MRPGQRCDHCKFWEFSKESTGYCRRYAPRPSIVNISKGETIDIIQPITSSDDWCGEFVVDNRVKSTYDKKNIFGLSVRAYGIVKRLNIYYKNGEYDIKTKDGIYNLLSGLSELNIRSMINCGRKTVNELLLWRDMNHKI